MSAAKQTPAAGEKVDCGLVMPISATNERRSAQYWGQVRQLMHRCILAAGMAPLDVWADDSQDKISSRIVSRLFELPSVLIDISDLNPNVMIELGLRLASEQPTVIVMNDESDIPFDIRDFRVLTYPSDLNLFAAETFVGNVAETLRSKDRAYRDQEYVPFLAGLVVKVAKPSAEEVPGFELIMDRLGDLSRKISRLERPREPTTAEAGFGPSFDSGNRITVRVPKDRLEDLVERMAMDDITTVPFDFEGKTYVRLEAPYETPALTRRLPWLEQHFDAEPLGIFENMLLGPVFAP